MVESAESIRAGSLAVLTRTILIVAAAVGLASCSGSFLINRNATDYAASRAVTADSQLLLNILRARDDLPIHFSDLSTIRGGIRLSSGVTGSFPLGIPFAGLPRPSLSPTVGAEVTPSFDLQTLDTTEFTTGITTPVAPRFLKLFYDQGVDPHLILILFFSQLEIGEHTPIYNNIACSNRRVVPALGEDCHYNIYDYLSAIDHLGKVVVRTYSELAPIGPPFTLDMSKQLKDVSSLEPGRRLVPAENGQFQLYSVTERFALCRRTGNHLEPLHNGDLRTCRDAEVFAIPGRTSHRNALYVRSVYQVIKYLGQVLKFQELRQREHPDRCLTIEKDSRVCSTGSVVFQVNGLRGSPAVTAEYGNGTYTVRGERCLIGEPCDHSVEVLAMLTVLLNASKSARDIPSTPVVRIE